MKRKIINTKLHGFLDYAFGSVLLLPYITKFNETGPDSLFLSAIGGMIIFTSALTDYEMGLIKILPMKIHLILDGCSSLLLIASPWLFTIYNYQLYWPLLLGLFGMLIVLLSSAEPYKITKRDLDITKP
jgi:hypothetical protein